MCQNSKFASSKKQNSLVLKLAIKFNGQIAAKIQSRLVFNRIHSDPENIFFICFCTLFAVLVVACFSFISLEAQFLLCVLRPPFSDSAQCWNHQ